MRTTRAVALTLLGGLLSGLLAACNQPADTPGGPDASSAARSGATAAAGRVQLTVRPGTGTQVFPSEEPGTPKQEGVVVDYTVVNGGSAPVQVHDLIPSGLGSATLPEDVNPEHVWVYLAKGRIRLSKQGFDAAPGVRFVAAPVVGARVLAPGQTLTGRAYAALPLDLDVPTPEFTAPRRPLDPGATEAELCLQVTTDATGRPWAADSAVLEVPVGEPAEGQLLCSQPWTLPAG